MSKQKEQKDGKWFCSSCKLWKLPEEFFKSSRTKNGLECQCKVCRRKKGNKKTIFAYGLKRHYGISVEEYENFLVKQNGVCAICGNKQPDSSKKSRLCVDHDHKTDKIRGLLCSNCNTALGLMKDDINRLAKAIEYLTNQNNT
jgi:hypothetical protein